MTTDWLLQIAPVVRPHSKGVGPYTSHGVAPADYVLPMRMIYDYELILYEGSRFLIETEDERIVLEPDSYVVLPPGQFHTELNIGSKRGHRYWCHFDWRWREDYEQLPIMTVMPSPTRFDLLRPAPSFVPQGVLHGSLANPGEAYALARKLVGIMTGDGPATFMYARAALLELLVAVLQEDGSGPVAVAAERSLASRTRQRLDEAFGAGPMITDLRHSLEDLGFSYEHICRVFSVTYGVSPGRYIQAKRMARARFLLQSTDMDIAEIGYRVGFNSPAYFTRIFRRSSGQTPSAYRVQQAGRAPLATV